MGTPSIEDVRFSFLIVTPVCMKASDKAAFLIESARRPVFLKCPKLKARTCSHRDSQKPIAETFALSFRQYKQVVDPAWFERDEAHDAILTDAPDFAVLKNVISEEGAVLVRRMQASQPRQSLVK